MKTVRGKFIRRETDADREKRFSGEGTEALYREHAGIPVIELELKSFLQLFDSFDPAPFHEKELNLDAEEYLYNAVDEFPLKKPLEIMIYLPSTEVNAQLETDLKEAIKNHFSYKRLLAEIELKRLLHQGRKNFIIALIFLFLCLLVIRLLSAFEESLVNTLFSEGLLIIGWVAMWEPVHIFLYGWWPIVHRRNIYEKIVHMDVYIGTGSPTKEMAQGYRFTPKKRF
ncbi:hypothetical protein [Methanosarcina acetivorans]|uniref:Uncharacterized protein n=1 Tax=Methanosarcina acetivorans (strain ATCC 35395 / DSM 2834 / JCM 12185 / C2A) TaxID=188937 RepID=Q8TP55_METAC|nr:hypothetical protein [Methanosarcina acetivorans]AAM05465.1 predicted protein [Methanosarcina acetivorans C2A]